MKSDYITRAKKFITKFYTWLEENEFNYDVWFCPSQMETAVAVYNRVHSRNIVFNHGAVRGALITSDYVVKWDYADEDDIKTYGGCDDEILVYEQISGNEFDYLFAAVTRVSIGNMAFNIMPRANGVGARRNRRDGIWHYLTKPERDFVIGIANVGDLHSYNWGWLHRRPLIIDYAG